MEQMEQTPLPSLSGPDALSDAALDLLESRKSRRGLIHCDGRIAVFGAALLGDLGFDEKDDLNGLAFATFWHPSERPAVMAALRRVHIEGVVVLKLDLSYAQKRNDTRQVRMKLAPEGDLIVVDLDREPASASG